MRKLDDITEERSPDWYKWLLENPHPRTREQVTSFRHTFADAKGEVLMMMILWPLELKRMEELLKSK